MFYFYNLTGKEGRRQVRDALHFKIFSESKESANLRYSARSFKQIAKIRIKQDILLMPPGTAAITKQHQRRLRR